ncbi:hypothetical protein [Nostoc sp. KVJ3]|uniref:hypothetical protein n=1 Tax=Nostoc sp. KVJ3 TaxID=457945 RepID=UPI0022384475|nr:hypothetical protein [Nostoc sp. KVJ3]
MPSLRGAHWGNARQLNECAEVFQGHCAPKEKEQTPLAEPENETGKDKTALALTSQNYELKQIRDRLPSPTPP